MRTDPRSLAVRLAARPTHALDSGSASRAFCQLSAMNRLKWEARSPTFISARLYFKDQHTFRCAPNTRGWDASRWRNSTNA